MNSTLLLNHIRVGKFEYDLFTGCKIAIFQTYILDDEQKYEIYMEHFHNNFIDDSFYVRYLLTEWLSNGDCEQTLFEFNSAECVSDKVDEYYQLNEVKETKKVKLRRKNK